MPPTIKETLKIRPMDEGDFNFVINSWLKTYKYSGPFKRVADRIYFDHYEPKVKTLIKKSDVYIACLKEDPAVIIGYLAIERKGSDIIHFCLVKDLWQKMGVAKYLLETAEPSRHASYTHWTDPMNSLSNKVTYTFNPFLKD